MSEAADVTETHLAAITSLDISDDADLTSLTAGDLSGLTGLTTIDLSGTGLDEVPLTVLTEVSTSLTSLDLSESLIENLNADAFKGLSSLKTLNLQDLWMEVKANAFRGLSSLTDLDLSGGTFTSLPTDAFKGLSSLKTLTMDTTEFTTLPSGIFSGLSSLTSISISNGYLATLPSGIFSGLTSLKTLNLSNNDINAGGLPSDIFDGLTALTSLDLSDNWVSFEEFDGIGGWDSSAGAPNAVTRGAVPGVSTSVLQNYPNPFNPETWIPYQLEKGAKVSLTIYDVRGVVVRKLDLGHKLEGRYISRSRAAYWDGRNSVGEKVAAGLYFYTIKAGDFTATRKMLIRK